MGRVLFDTATSIDGFLADPDGSLDWLFAVDGGEHPDEGLFPTGASVLVEGSTTYEWLLREKQVLEHPGRWQELHGDRPTFVFSSRDLPVPEGADVRVVRGPVADVLPAVREAAGDGDVWVVGGGDLAAQFLEAGALDEIALSVAPVSLGGGAPLLPRRVGSERLRLVSATAVGQFAGSSTPSGRPRADAPPRAGRAGQRRPSPAGAATSSRTARSSVSRPPCQLLAAPSRASSVCRGPSGAAGSTSASTSPTRPGPSSSPGRRGPRPGRR